MQTLQTSSRISRSVWPVPTVGDSANVIAGRITGLFASLLCSCWTSVAAEPQQLEINRQHHERIEELVQRSIDQEQLPGCVICVGQRDRVVYLQAFGDRQLEPERVAMTTDTVFDMASLTKPVATATSIMKLVEEGQVRLAARAAEYLPEFGKHGKQRITIHDLLTHQSGLIPDNPLSDYQDGPEKAWERVCDLELTSEIGQGFRYSDVNFIVLAKLVERVAEQSIDRFSREHIFKLLGMQTTGFMIDESLKGRAAPTERRDGEWIRGEVHDPRAYALEGIAGHAGLFSTAEDLARFAQMFLRNGSVSDTHATGADPTTTQYILSPRTIATMTRGYRVSSGVRGLGWDKQTGYSSNKGDLLSDAAFGHGGFTGTVLWIDPELDLFFVFLSNRLHPNGKGSVNGLAGQIANIVASAARIQASSSGSGPGHREFPIMLGIDSLQRDRFRPLADQRVGLITNHTGVNQDGVSSVELLSDAEEVELVALFSPEHGFAGELDQAEISDASDAETGLKIYSLYGKTRRPTPEMLDGLDTIVFDIQDIGARFYTYISTMGEAMQAAAEHGKRFVVLDRPNPINGVSIAGPMLDAGSESFVGFHRLPVRHAMTIGEIASLLKDERELDLDLEVIRCVGWQREIYYDRTNLMWVNPSPNMRCLTQAILYPGIGLLETTNISVGRGTDTPFEVIAAPWIDGQRLARRLNALNLPGVTFIPIRITPESSKHAGHECGGVNIMLIERDAFDPLQTGLQIALQLRSLYPDQWDTKNLNRLLGNRRVFEAIVAEQSIDTVLELAAEDISSFKRRRAAHLLYP